MASRSPSPGTPGTPGAKTDLSGAKVPKFNNGWTKEQEELMAGWADIAGCYRWMHDRCEKISARSNLWITIPVIILSTLTGSANFMMQNLVGDDKDAQKYAQIGVGGVSIFTGILTTLGNFFRYAQNSESNRVASIAWGKFHRQVAVELRLHPKERIDSMDFLKICRADLDRLIEQSPPIPDVVIHAFEKEFSDRQNLKKPDIAHGLDHTIVFVDTENRMKKMAVDAAVMMKQKRKVWHEAMMPDVDAHLDKKLTKVMSDISGNYFRTLQDKVKELEEVVKRQEERLKEEDNHKKRRESVAHIRSFIRPVGKSAEPVVPVGRENRFLRGTSTVKVTPRPSAGIVVPPTPLAQKTVDHTVPHDTPTTHQELISALTQPSFADANFSMTFHTDPEEKGAEVIVPPEEEVVSDSEGERPAV
jgi:hypothetical protein